MSKYLEWLWINALILVGKAKSGGIFTEEDIKLYKEIKEHHLFLTNNEIKLIEKHLKRIK